MCERLYFFLESWLFFPFLGNLRGKLDAYKKGFRTDAYMKHLYWSRPACLTYASEAEFYPENFEKDRRALLPRLVAQYLSEERREVPLYILKTIACCIQKNTACASLLLFIVGRRIRSVAVAPRALLTEQARSWRRPPRCLRPLVTFSDDYFGDLKLSNFWTRFKAQQKW